MANRSRIRLTFAASAALAAVSALAFANNCVAIVRWWRAFLAAGGDSSAVSAHAPGFLPWLDWTAVDYSAVTTFIPLLGFACMARAGWRMLHGRRADAADFPFFRGSDQLNVALGLFGTLWGIIVIGYFKLDTVTMADLMQCLHTALFSTLMAVVWVFMFDRPVVRPLFAKLLAAEGLAVEDGGDLAAAVGRMVAHLGEASDAFDRRQREYEATFERRLGEYEAACEKRQAASDAALGRRQDAFEEAYLARLAKGEAEIVRRNAEADQAVRARFEDAEAAFEKRRMAWETAFERRLADYDAEFARRQQEYNEFFQRRIAELQRLADEARDRAEASDRKLKAVAAAMN